MAGGKRKVGIYIDLRPRKRSPELLRPLASHNSGNTVSSSSTSTTINLFEAATAALCRCLRVDRNLPEDEIEKIIETFRLALGELNHQGSAIKFSYDSSVRHSIDHVRLMEVSKMLMSNAKF
jgi:hypothetical protein